MISGRSGRGGFTLIEMMVSIAVLLALTLLAVPSFEAVRQRAALRGAAEQTLSFWNQARFEAAKRNALVKVGVVQSGSGAIFCLGAATTTNAADTAPCDCTTAAPADSTTTCDVARFPANQSEWDRVTLSGVTLGGTTALTAIKPAVIESKRTTLTSSAAAGTITLIGPPGRNAYRLQLVVTPLGRGWLCEPAAATHKMSDFGSRRCN